MFDILKHFIMVLNSNSYILLQHSRQEKNKESEFDWTINIGKM